MDNLPPRRLRAGDALRSKRSVKFSKSRFDTALHDCFRASGLEVYHVGRIGLLPEDSLEFAYRYLIDNIYSKYSTGETNDELRNEALRRFHLAEAGCQLMNQKFSHINGLYGPYTREINLARNLIWDLLGASVNMGEIAPHFGFGPGASTRLKRSRGDRSFKFSGIPETTLQNVTFLGDVFSNAPLWGRLIQNCSCCHNGEIPYTVVAGCNIDTVPKNSKTDRVIAIEPDLNMYVQKGFGAFLRRRLLRVGIDLNNQENNQSYAYKAYSEGFATIDLSMASDTISSNLVKNLLPNDWYEKLDACRSKFGVLPSGELHRFQKFSSMGNGFTFELETLIFWALAESVRLIHGEGGRVLVYGDDIITPQAIAPKVIDLLAFCGFNTNTDKTFISGSFYESCGKHYHKGHDITPFFIRRPIDNFEELILLHNNIYRYVARIEHLLSEQSLRLFSRLMYDLRALVPSYVRRMRIPDGFGDGAFVADLPDIILTKDKNFWDGYQLMHFVPKTNSLIHSSDGLLAKAILRVGYSDDSSVYPTKLAPGLRKARLFLSRDKIANLDPGWTERVSSGP